MRIVYHPEAEKVIRRLSGSENSRVLKVVDLFGDYKFSLTQLFLKKIAREIWELRAGRYRLLFGVIQGNAIITRIFLKKTQKTPNKEIDLAIKRLKEYE